MGDRAAPHLQASASLPAEGLGSKRREGSLLVPQLSVKEQELEEIAENMGER